MMKSAYKLLLTLLVFGVAAGILPAANLQEFTKAIKREFDITATGTTSITNKYGKIDVKTWNQNRVKIEVTIIVRASSESAAQRVFERIDIAFSNSPTTVKAVTTIEPRDKSFWDWSDNDKSDYSINYEVFLPASNNLEIDHKYGDVYVAAMTGKITADIKYANIKLEDASDDSRLTLGYGNGSVVRAKDFYSDVSYGKLIINEAQDVEVMSKYAKVTIDQAADVRSTTKYDDYDLGTVHNFYNTGKYDDLNIGDAATVEVNSKYTQVRARRVAGRIDLDLEYGGADFGLARDFTEANLIGRYTDFKLSVEAGANYQMDATASYAGIAYPRAMTVTYELEKGSSHEVKGHQGRENAGSFIKARLSYGGLKVREE